MTGRYYGTDATKFFYPPVEDDYDETQGIRGILQPMPMVKGLVLKIIEQTGTFPTADHWIEIRQALAKDAEDLEVTRAFFEPLTVGKITFNEAVEKLKALKSKVLKSPQEYSDMYDVKWDVPWSEHIKTVTEIKSALDSTKGLTKQMLTTPFI